MSKRPSCQFGQVDLDLSYVIWVVILTSKLLDYFISHFDYWIIDHLTSQISTHFLKKNLQKQFM
jgi:hypothetical protein